MRVIDLENINYNMRNQTQFVLRCEEVYHDKVSAAVGTILSNRKPFVALTGPSGSGKTTTAMRLREYLENLGVKGNKVSIGLENGKIVIGVPEADHGETA